MNKISWRYDSRKDMMIGETVFKADLFYTIKPYSFGFALNRVYKGKDIKEVYFHSCLRDAKRQAKANLAEMIEYLRED